MTTTTNALDLTHFYHVAPALWQEPRCYWQAAASGAGIALQPLPTHGSALAFRFKLHARPDGTVTLATSHGPARLDGRSLVVCGPNENESAATPFRLHAVGSCFALEVADGSGRLVECEGGYLGATTSIQVWKTALAASIPSDWTTLPADQQRTLWKFDRSDGFIASAWMARLANKDTPLNELAMVGTHDSTTWKWDSANYSRTQELTFLEQLKIGVRYFDLRLGDDFENYHGGKNGFSFDDVLKDAGQFLGAHGGEVILLAINRDSDAPKEPAKVAQFASDIEDVVLHRSRRVQHQVRWFAENRIPTVREAFGRVVLVRRYADPRPTAPGIVLTNWPDSSSTTFDNTVGGVTVRIQDEYRLVQNSSKKDAIRRLWADMTAATPPANRWSINFTSAGQAQQPRTYANDINPWLGANLNFTGSLRGMFVTDFPSAALVDRVLRFNAFY